MKKIWSYLAVGFAFFSAGLIAMYKLMGEQIKIEVHKVKNKRTSGNTSTTIPINLESPKTGRKSGNSAKKQARIDKRKNKQHE